MNTIQSSWEDYRSKVLPQDAPSIQITECRRAFYAGANSLLHLSMTISMLSDDAGVHALEGLHQEVQQFKNAVMDGKA